MEITYEDYRLALRDAAEKMDMDTVSNFKKEVFDSKFNQQLIKDSSLTEENVMLIMALANSYLETSLFVGLIKHPNFTMGALNFWLDRRDFNGELHSKQFHLAVLRHTKGILTPQFTSSCLESYSTDIWVAMLESEEACKIVSLFDKVELLKANKENDSFVPRVKQFNHLNDVFEKVYELYQIETYLPDDVKEMFLF